MELQTKTWFEQVVEKWLQRSVELEVPYETMERARAAIDAEGFAGQLPVDLGMVREFYLQAREHVEVLEDGSMDTTELICCEVGRLAALTEAAYALGYNNCRDGCGAEVPALEMDLEDVT